MIESHEVLEIVIKRQPVKLSNSGQLTLNADAIQPTVTPIEQVPEASVVQLQKLEEQEDVPAEQLTAAQKAAMRTGSSGRSRPPPRTRPHPIVSS